MNTNINTGKLVCCHIYKKFTLISIFIVSILYNNSYNVYLISYLLNNQVNML